MTRAYTLKDVADQLGIGHSTLRKIIAAGNGPACVHIGRSVRVLEPDLAGWLAVLPRTVDPCRVSGEGGAS